MQRYLKQIYVRLLGVGLVVMVLATTVFSQNMFRKMNDFDGDGKADFVVVRNEGNFPETYKIWYIWQSRDGFRVFRWGINGDGNAPGDYDGDGKTDIAIFRGQNFPDPNNPPRFWIWNSGSSSGTQVDFELFLTNGVMQQDYNGDGKTDAALWEGNIQEPPGSGATTVRVKYSGTGGTLNYQIPPFSFPFRSGDMTGDGRSDNVYVTYTSHPFVVKVTDIVNGSSRSVGFAMSGDAFVPADFDGDGIGDMAVFRGSDGTWWWLRSSDNTARAARWGMNGDRPVAADYDGDGITDLAIWRPGSGQAYYWVNGSQNGIGVFPWGLPTDTIIQP